MIRASVPLPLSGRGGLLLSGLSGRPRLLAADWFNQSFAERFFLGPLGDSGKVWLIAELDVRGLAMALQRLNLFSPLLIDSAVPRITVD